jgi:hypothetical protein
MPFESPDYPLSDLMKVVGTGRLQLPDFQREWKWDDDRIRSLLASISLGHPVGVVMMLETGAADVKFAAKTLAGVDPKEVLAPPERLLLDGQQRLTSLFQALSSGAPVQTADARGKKLTRWYYVDIGAALGDPGDRDEAVVSVPEDKTVRDDFGRVVVKDYSTLTLECHEEMFPLSRVFDSAATNEWMVAYLQLDSAQMPARLARWNLFQQRVLANFTGYLVPVIVLTKDTPREAVCTVFEKVNTGGVPLNVFELLTAMFASDGFKLNEDWRVRKTRLLQRRALGSLESSDYLQVITLLATRKRRLAWSGPAGDAPGISCKRKDILRLTLDEYQDWADRVTEAFDWAATFLAEERIFTASDLPYRTQLVPLAAIRVTLGPRIDNHGILAKVRQWYWCGVLGELYGGATETRFARDLEQVGDWAQGSGAVPGTVEAASFRAGRLLTLRTRNSAAYKGIYSLLMRRGCLDWQKHQNISMANFFDYRVDIHHIFPKAWCAKHGVDIAKQESIVNKTAISFDTNRSIGGRAPEDYLRILERRAGILAVKLDGIVATHAIDPGTLRAGDFDMFFSDRRARLIAIISEAMGKPVTGEEDTTGEGSAAAFEPEPPDMEDVPDPVS